MTGGRFDAFDHLRGGWPSPDGRRVAFVSDASGRPQPWVMAIPGDGAEGGSGAREARELPVPGAVARCVWRPDGRRILVQTDISGHEDYRLAEVDPDGGTAEWIAAEPGVRTEIGIPYGSVDDPYSPDATLLAFASNARDREVFDVIVRDLRTGAERTVLVGDDRYLPASFSPDSTRLLVQKHHQRTERALYLCDLRDGSVRLLTPDEGPAKNLPIGWSADGEAVFLCTTRGRGHLGLAELRLDTGKTVWHDAGEYDIEGGAVSPDGRHVAWAVNEGGFSRLRCLDVGTGTVRDVECLPAGVYVQEDGLGGYGLRFASPQEVIVQVGQPSAAAELYLLRLGAHASGDTARRLTDCGRQLPAAEMAAHASGPEAVSYRSADGTVVTGLLFRPSGASREKPAPVVVIVHGGPEWQAFPEFDPMTHELLALGIGVLAPNIRGSSGRGLPYQRLIYRDWGGGDLADLEATARFAAGLEWADGTRLGVYGASYGGFAALSCLTRLPGLWRAGVSECGVSDLLNDVRNFPPSWRRRVVGWIGDPEDPADAARMREASPLTHAHRLRAPLLLIHGTNDTRVAFEESERMFQLLTGLGLPVAFLREEGVGHDPTDRAARQRSTAATVEWFSRHLAEPAAPGAPSS